MRVSILGMGNMGRAFATRAIETGHQTTIWNRTPGRVAALVAAGAIEANTSMAAARCLSAPLPETSRSAVHWWREPSPDDTLTPLWGAVDDGQPSMRMHTLNSGARMPGAPGITAGPASQGLCSRHSAAWLLAGWFRHTEMWSVLCASKGRQCQSAQRCSRVIPLRRAMRSSLAGQA